MQSGTSTRARDTALIVVASVLWGTVTVATKALYGLSATNALSIGFFRLAIATPALALATLLLVGSLRVPRAAVRPVWLLGLAMALYQVCLFSAIPLIGVTIAVLIALCVAPVIVALVSVPLFRERLTLPLLAALAMALMGVGLLVAGGSSVAVAGAAVGSGVVLALGAAASYAVVTLCGRVLADRCHPLQTLTLSFGLGALLLFPAALAGGLVSDYPLAGWGLLLHLGLVPTALAYVLFLLGMRSVSATAASIITLLEPLTAAVLAWWFFDERLGLVGLSGGALLLLAIGVLTRWPAAPASQTEVKE